MHGGLEMKYGELIQFEPISSVIQLIESNDKDKAQDLVKTYVAAPSMEEKFEKQIVKHLQFDVPADNKALMIIGNYATGKSHLMSVISSIAEDAAEVDNLRSNELKDIGANEKKQDEKNREAYAMPKTAMEIDTLLSRSQQLAGLEEDGNDN